MRRQFLVPAVVLASCLLPCPCFAQFNQPDAVVVVPGNALFTDTGVYIPQGGNYFILAEGAVCFGHPTTEIRSVTDPDGEATNVGESGCHIAAPKNCMIGKLGPSGSAFAVGSKFAGSNSGTGANLYLGVNDDIHADNVGSYIAYIWVWGGTQAVEADRDSHTLETGGLTNCPNPFNPETTIRFSVQKAGPVTVRVYDVQGKLVRTLIDGQRDAGEHSVLWDGTDEGRMPVSSGTYFYQVIQENLTQSKKAILLK